MSGEPGTYAATLAAEKEWAAKLTRNTDPSKPYEAIHTILFEALGAASLCWTTGVFDSSTAASIGGGAWRAISELVSRLDVGAPPSGGPVVVS